jgi:hypothetical protein
VREPERNAERERPVLAQFADRLDRQFHECVPLGWEPVIFPSRGFIPGFNADAVAHGGMLQARWAGSLPARATTNAHAERVRAILDAFVAAGLLARREVDGRARYTLTEAGDAAYYDRDRLGTDAEGWPYFCYSRLDVATVAWAGPSSRDAYGEETRRIRFRWKPGAAAAWATPFLTAHAVELDPRASPTGAVTVRGGDGVWRMLALDFTLPRVEHPAAWAASGT